MRRTLLILSLATAAHAMALPAAGYKGHRFIVGGEFAYSPFFTSVRDFYTKYNVQYGGQLHVIVGRYVQVGLSYNRWSLKHNQVFEGNFDASDRVNGAQYGLTFRKFRKNKGSLAPIGRFMDLSLGYAQNEFVPGAGNDDAGGDNLQRLPRRSDMITANISFGAQQVYWKHLVASSGVRFGAPLFEVQSVEGTAYRGFMLERIAFKEIFSVFFGIGILI
jgi:hypothetical protein